MTELENNSSATCISESNTCPASPVGTCNHSKDVTIECGMLIYMFRLIVNLYNNIAFFTDFTTNQTNNNNIINTCSLLSDNIGM